MKRILTLADVLLIVGTLFSAFVLAQNDTTTASAPDGSLKFAYPADWELNTDEGIVLTNGTSTITIFTPDAIAAIAPDAADANDALAALADAQEMGSGSTTSLSNADRTILTMRNSDHVLMLTEIDDGLYAALLANSGADSRALRALIDTFRTPGKDIAAPSITINLVPCTVRTEEARTVRVRVGPGTNRTSIAFLPPGEDFTVLGQATANDDSLWWKLDKETVAPSSAANEVWVAEADVAESGDCEAVIDVAAPPIIPIVQQQPTPVPGSSGETTAVQASGPDPVAGRWTLTPVRVYLSCVGTATYNFTAAEMGFFPESYRASLSADKATLTFGGFPLARTGPADFSGAIVFGGDSVQLFLTVVGPTEMSGRIIYTTTINGVACSATIPVTATAG